MIKLDVRIIKDEIQPMLAELRKRVSDLSPMMKNVGETALTSIRKNFEVGGRPSKWPGLKLSTINQRTAQGHWPGKILVRHGVSGGLLGSISYKAGSDRVVLSANKVYAAVHHFGGEIKIKEGQRVIHFSGEYGKQVRFSKVGKASFAMKAKAHVIKIPKRPFMLIQKEDWLEIKKLAGDYLIKSKV